MCVCVCVCAWSCGVPWGVRLPTSCVVLGSGGWVGARRGTGNQTSREARYQPRKQSRLPDFLTSPPKSCAHTSRIFLRRFPGKANCIHQPGARLPEHSREISHAGRVPVRCAPGSVTAHESGRHACVPALRAQGGCIDLPLGPPAEVPRSAPPLRAQRGHAARPRESQDKKKQGFSRKSLFFVQLSQNPAVRLHFL